MIPAMARHRSRIVSTRPMSNFGYISLQYHEPGQSERSPEDPPVSVGAPRSGHRPGHLLFGNTISSNFLQASPPISPRVVRRVASDETFVMRGCPTRSWAGPSRAAGRASVLRFVRESTA